MKLSDVLIDDPCEEPEERMTRKPGGHYCLRCEKHVYDLSAMSEDAAIALLALNSNREICVSYLVDDEGELWHSPKPSQQSNSRLLPLVGAATLAAACNQPEPSESPVTSASSQAALSSRQMTTSKPAISASATAPHPSIGGQQGASAPTSPAAPMSPAAPAVSDSECEGEATPTGETAKQDATGTANSPAPVQKKRRRLRGKPKPPHTQL